MKLTDVISKKVIEGARTEGACDAALEYATAKPRTYNQLYRKDVYWLYWLARFTNVRAVLGMLALHKSPSIRRRVVGNPATPKAVLKKLSKDKNTEVKSNAIFLLKYPPR